LLLDDVALMVRAALNGVGLAFLDEEHAEPCLKTGALVRVLEEPSR
jgi:DNA-binding transcriptional LysR family regulator